MSEFNELVRAFLLGNNIHFEESEKEHNVFIISEMEKKMGFMPKLFEGLKMQRELLKIFVLDDLEETFEINDEVDIIIWNDSFSGRNLEARIKERLRLKQKNNDEIIKNIRQVDSRYLGMGKDILFAKFSDKEKLSDLLEVGKISGISASEEKKFFKNEMLGEKRFVFIIEETDETQYLKREFNRFMDSFCGEEEGAGKSLPIYFESIDFWFGGLLHSQLTNRLNQDLGLFLTEDTVFYMARLGYIIPFIDKLDLFCQESYLNPQAARISHLFHLCGERGMFIAGCSRESILYQDVREGIDLKNLGIEDDNKWFNMIAKPMGSRILEDEANAAVFGMDIEKTIQPEIDTILQDNEKKLKRWLENTDFPILKPGDKMVLIKKMAAKWMARNSFYLELKEFQAILFDCNILPEGKRTLADIHEITRAVMISNILILSDFDQVIPVSRLMGEAIILWMLVDEFNIKESMASWLNRQGFNQNLFNKLLKRFADDKEKNILTPLSMEIMDIINKGPAFSDSQDQTITRNALEMHIGLKNSGYKKEFQVVSSQGLNDLNLSQELVKGIIFESADMHNILFQQSVFIDCHFIMCNLTSSYFAGSTFLNCRIEKSDLRNADFSGSFFRGCNLDKNKYEDLILIGCSFENCRMDIDTSNEDERHGARIKMDGTSGLQGQEKANASDLPVLIYLLQKNHRFYSRYGFKINADVGFSHFNFHTQPGALNNEQFLDQYNYYDVYDEITMKPELFFARSGSIHYIKEGTKKDFPMHKDQEIYIDHVIKYNEPGNNNASGIRTKILFHTVDNTFIEDNPDENEWFKNSFSISNRFIGRGVSAIFLNPEKILAATNIGGLFLLEWQNGNWINIGSKFQSEPVSKIFPDCFESMAFVIRGSSVIEIWDTLNDLSFVSRLVTSFKKVLDIRLIENLNHLFVYGEWADNSIGALVYNIINKHLITYWNILPGEELEKLCLKDFQNLERMYSNEIGKFLEILKNKKLRQVSLADGFIKKGCNELRQIMDTLDIIPPNNLFYMEGETVEFEWKIKSKNPGKFPLTKSFTDITTGKKVDFEFEIKILNLKNVQSGEWTSDNGESDISVLWKEKELIMPKDSSWGDYQINFGFSLLGEWKQRDDILKIRPKNPFRGGKSLSKETGSDYLFVGREKELKKALGLIEDGASFTIKGARRIGKTSFMNRLLENLPRNVLAAYISLDEFEKSASQSVLLAGVQNSLVDLQKKYPDIYNEFSSDFEALRKTKPSLDFEWLMSVGLERLKTKYPDLLSEIWLNLEKDREPGKSLRIFLESLYKKLKEFDPPMQLVFIIDEIGIAHDKGAKLRDIFNPFRTIIERCDIVIILAGIPENFSELTTRADLMRDSGLMSFLNNHIVLGPLTDTECKTLIKNNISRRIKINDDVLNRALQFSARRPEDLQIIMQQALEEASDGCDLHKKDLSIEDQHIDKGFDKLLKERGHTCSKIWDKISGKGQIYLKNKFSAGNKDYKYQLDKALDELDIKNISTEDFEILKGYGFTNPDEKQLIIPVYFQEWIRLEYFKLIFEKEEEKYEN